MESNDKTMNVGTTKGDLLCRTKAEIAEIIKQGAALQQGDEIWMHGSLAGILTRK